MASSTKSDRVSREAKPAKESAERQRVQSQLTPLEERRARFTKELAEAETKARAEQDALADGDGSADAVATADARVRALHQALTAIEGKIAPLRTALQEIDAAADFAARRARTIELGRAMATHVRELDECRKQAVDEINDAIMAVYAKHSAALDTLEEFSTLRRSVDLTPKELEQEAVDIAPLNAEEWKSRQAFRMKIAPTRVLPPLGWIGDLIDRAVEGMISSRRG